MINWLKIFADDAGTVEQNLKQRLPNTDTSKLADNALILQILNWGYVIAGIVAVGFIVYGAWKYISANGEPDRIRSGTNTILFSIIGLVVVLLAAAITNFVLFNVGSNIQ